MFSIIFEFFNFRKHPTHFWLIVAAIPLIIVLVYVALDELRIKIDFLKEIDDYFFILITPLNLLGVGVFSYSYFKAHPQFFKLSVFHRVMLYLFMTATLVNFIWILWMQIDAFQCRKFLCGYGIIPPFGSIVITTGLMLLYSLILFGRVKKYQLVNTNLSS